MRSCSAQLGTFPRATNQDVGFGKLDYQINAAQSPEHVVRLHELPRAQCLQHRAFVQQRLSLSTNGSYVFHERIFVANWDSTITQHAW